LLLVGLHKFIFTSVSNTLIKKYIKEKFVFINISQTFIKVMITSLIYKSHFFWFFKQYFKDICEHIFLNFKYKPGLLWILW